MIRSACFLIYFICLVIFQASGQHLFEEAIDSHSPKDSTGRNPEIHGFIRGAAYSPLKNDRINGWYTQAGWTSEAGINKLHLTTDLRFSYGQVFLDQISSLNLRTCLIHYGGERWSLDIGRQVINWGTGDGFNPTNNLSATDFFSLTEEPSERSLPNFALSGQFSIRPNLTLQGIVQPAYVPSVYRYDLINPAENAVFTHPVTDPLAFREGACALKVRAHFPSISLSLSAFRGNDPMPWVRVDQVRFDTGSIPLIEYRPSPFRKTSLGSDFEGSVGKLILRGEIALDLVETQSDPNISAPGKLAYVFNLETRLSSWNVLIQYVGNHVTGFKPLSEPTLPENPGPDELLNYQIQWIDYETERFNRKVFFLEKAWNHALSLHLLKDFQSEKIRTELGAYYSLSTREWMIAPKISWKWDQSIKMTIGYYHYHGGEDSLFDLISPFLSNFYIEWTARF
jgi:hypothetical protein